MRRTITISLPEELKQQLDQAAAADGVSRSDLLRQSLQEHLFVRSLRALRRKMIPSAESCGVFTDQDVFDRVS